MEKFFKSVKTGMVAELVGKTEHGVIILLPEGDERVLATTTFERWWKPSSIKELPNDPKQETKEINVLKQQLPLGNSFQELFIIAARKLAETVNSELFVRTGTSYYNFRKNGTIYLAFTVTKKSIHIHAKSKAIGTAYQHRKIKHNFDNKITVFEWNTKVYEMLQDIHQMSLVYQIKNIK